MENLIVRDIAFDEVPHAADVYSVAEQEALRLSGGAVMDGVMSQRMRHLMTMSLREEWSLIQARLKPGRELRGVFGDAGLLGYVRLYPSGLSEYKDWGYVEELYVRPEHWGKGIGRALFNDAVRICREASFTHMFLHTKRDNAVANPFYRRLGGLSEDLAINVRRYIWPLHEAPAQG